MPKRRERPIPRTNPSGEKVWVARATDPDGERHHRGTFKLRREAQDAIDLAYQEWEKPPVARDTVGQYAADWTQRHPRSERTNYDRDSKLRQVLDVEIEGRKLRDWPLAELERSHARDLVDHMLRRQGRAVAGAAQSCAYCRRWLRTRLTIDVRPSIPSRACGCAPGIRG